MATIKEMLTANTADILEATELLKVLSDREGQFVWKQLTAEGGDFVAFVTADDENSYPDGGTQDGYWYELMGKEDEGGIEGFDTGEVILSSAQSNIVIEHTVAGAKRAMLVPISMPYAVTDINFVYSSQTVIVGSNIYSYVIDQDSILRSFTKAIATITDTSVTFPQMTLGGMPKQYGTGTYRWMVWA